MSKNQRDMGRGLRYIPKMMENLILLRRLEKIGYTIKT